MLLTRLLMHSPSIFSTSFISQSLLVPQLLSHTVSSISKYLESSSMSNSDIWLSQQSLHHSHQQANHSPATPKETHISHFSFCCNFSSHHASLFPTTPIPCKNRLLFQPTHMVGMHVHYCYVFSQTHVKLCCHSHVPSHLLAVVAHACNEIVMSVLHSQLSYLVQYCIG